MFRKSRFVQTDGNRTLPLHTGLSQQQSDVTHKHDFQGEPSVEPEKWCTQTISVLLDMDIVGSRSNHYVVWLFFSSVHKLLLIEHQLFVVCCILTIPATRDQLLICSNVYISLK